MSTSGNFGDIREGIFLRGLQGETPSYPVAVDALEALAKEKLGPKLYGYVAGGALGDTPRWFQLYWLKEDVLTKSFLRRAEDAGYSALVVTVDTKFTGWRTQDVGNAYEPFVLGKGLGNFFSDPIIRDALEEDPEENMMAALVHQRDVFRNFDQDWDDLAFLRENTNLPIVLKGILHPADALKAVETGMDGLIVSTHGGRQVDGSIAALDALPAIVEAVGEKMPVLFDSGIRHGADIMKALALGADAVLLGRPYIWGLAVGGEAGVRQVLEFLLADYDMNMAHSGFTAPGQLGRDALLRG